MKSSTPISTKAVVPSTEISAIRKKQSLLRFFFHGLRRKFQNLFVSIDRAATHETIIQDRERFDRERPYYRDIEYFRWFH